MWSRLFLGTGAAVLLLLTSCAPEGRIESDWYLDDDYSAEIVGISVGPELDLELSETIDEVQIFWTPVRRISSSLSVERIRKWQFVYETRERGTVARIALALRDIEESVDCRRDTAEGVYHILVLDEDARRAGYYTYQRCTDKDARLGMVIPLGSPAILYTRRLGAFLSQVESLK